MTWRKLVVPISLGSLVTIIGVSVAAGNTVTTHVELPTRIEAVEDRLTRVEGKVDTVINLLRGRR